METLSSVLNNSAATQLESALERKLYSPRLAKLEEPEHAVAFLQANICASYVFTRYTVPTYASYVFSSLREIGPVTDTIGPLLKGVSEMIEGELFNNNVYERDGECHSHYFDMLEAYEAAGGSMQRVNAFMDYEKAKGFEAAIHMTELWSKRLVEYTKRTKKCLEDPLATFILFPATEVVTPKIFEYALQHLSKEPQFDKFRTFLRKHVELDTDDHGPIALQWLDAYIKATNQPPERVLEATQKVLDVFTM